jgi:dihydrofolate synthase / folylpolyglutamate synthase
MPDNSILYLNSLGLHKVKPGLDRIKIILGALGNPEQNAPGIIVGGTNGKGSVASSIASVLSEAGYKTGLYTSPHLVRLTERIRINGASIKEDELSTYIERVRRAAEMSAIEPSYFEVLTACAYLYFSDNENDLNVLEVGLGGRWDATNVIQPLVSVITNISKDHIEYLGETETEIASEKACIIKPGAPVVTGARGEALEVIQGKVHKTSSELYISGKDFKLTDTKDGRLYYIGSKWNIENISSNLKGLYQNENLALAIKALELLTESGHVNIEVETLRKGLSHINWEGRFQVVRTSPPLILDSAHNPGAAKALVSSLKDYYPGVKFTFLIGMLGDKDHNAFIEEIAQIAGKIIITHVPSERSTETNKLYESAKKHIHNVVIVEDYKKAYKELIHKKQPGCTTGSLYLIGALKDKHQNK